MLAALLLVPVDDGLADHEQAYIEENVEICHNGSKVKKILKYRISCLTENSPYKCESRESDCKVSDYGIHTHTDVIHYVDKMMKLLILHKSNLTNFSRIDIDGSNASRKMLIQNCLNEVLQKMEGLSRIL